MNRERITARCRELGLDPHTLARQASVDPFFLVDRLGLRAAADLPVSLLAFLSRALGLHVEEILYGRSPDLDQVGDDLRVEAALHTADTLSRDDIAHVFGWTLDRTERALGGLETRLRHTGTRLHHADGHRYWLGPARSVLSTHDLARIRQRERGRDSIAVDEAQVLHLIMAGWVDKRIWAETAAQDVVDRLLAAGLLVDSGGTLGEPWDVRYSLGLSY